jgi:anaphase-promoting complex subunit 1
LHAVVNADLSGAELHTHCSEHDLAKELAVTVNHIVERTFAQPFGRAIYTFGSVMRLTRDEYFVPPIEMQVKFVPHNVTYPPDATKIQPEAKQWAEFHNGLAAALRLNPRAEGIDSSWIAFNKPQELSAEHAGYLLGLGLTGHLRSMWNWHGYRYLLPKHELTSIAVLLGLGASHAGSGDPEVTRLITIHMRPLLPPDSAELGIPLGAQSAALMGLGLLYLGTGNSTMADVAMRELSVAHLSGGPEISNEHREAYTLTAGLSYGLIMCGLGSSTIGPSDDGHLTKLRAFVAGKESPAASTIFSSRHPTASSINLNYVSPAATVALALMFLKTNRSDIASSFALPPDPAGLKDVQPSLLLLRALGRSLIMWDDITPTVAWVLSQAQRTPKDLSKKQLQEGVRELYEFAFFNILSGACLAIGLKYAGQATAAANHVLVHFHDKLLENLRRQPPGK